MTKEKQIKDTTQYYVLRNKDTGMYFRGKGINRWGKYFNQATIYRIKGTAEASVREVAWHGEKAEVVPIQIFENKTSDIAKEISSHIERAVEIAIDTVISEIRKHRKTYDLDPVWLPTLSWLKEISDSLRKEFEKIFKQEDSKC